MDNRCVVVCDSGVGGLKIAENIRKNFPEEDIVYLSDSKNMPYGSKTENEMSAIADDVIKRSLSFAPKLIVAACNTLSVTLEKNRVDYGVKIVKTLPEFCDGRGYVFCTPRTAESNYVKIFAKGETRVIPLYGVAEIIEECVRAGRELPDLSDRFSDLGKDVDFISLGCTHYAYISDLLKRVFPTAKILDGADKAYRKVASFLTEYPCRTKNGLTYFTDSWHAFA